MLNFAEQTGSGAVIVVWSFLIVLVKIKYINPSYNADYQSLPGCIIQQPVLYVLLKGAFTQSKTCKDTHQTSSTKESKKISLAKLAEITATLYPFKFPNTLTTSPNSHSPPQPPPTLTHHQSHCQNQTTTPKDVAIS